MAMMWRVAERECACYGRTEGAYSSNCSPLQLLLLLPLQLQLLVLLLLSARWPSSRLPSVRRRLPSVSVCLPSSHRRCRCLTAFSARLNTRYDRSLVDQLHTDRLSQCKYYSLTAVSMPKFLSRLWVWWFVC